MEKNELADIDKQIEALQAKRKEIFDAKRAEALKEVRAIITRFGFTATELGVKAGSRAKQPKDLKPGIFRNPGTDKTWNSSQRGPTPGWAKKKIADGTIENCRVP